MKTTNISLFCQLLQIIDHHRFTEIVKFYDGDKHSKGFSCQEQLVCLLFCQMAQARSLREIENGLKICEGQLFHLGLSKAPNRSTLSYANANRPWQIYEACFYALLEKCQGEMQQGKTKFRFHNQLLSFDSSTISLCLNLFDWAKFRQTKGAVKLHLLLDHDGYLPVFVKITDGKTHDVNLARGLQLPPGSIIVADRGYVDYELFQKWNQEKAFFVVRMKDNAVYGTVRQLPVLKNREVLSDSLIELTGVQTHKKYPGVLRRVVVWDEVNQCEIVLVTNNFALSASTIGKIYRERWQIELFFKAIKQNLKVKTFIGTSENALYTQIWTALISILLLKYLQYRSTASWALSNLVAVIRWNLFVHRCLWECLNNPTGIQDAGGPGDKQLELFGTASIRK